MKFRSFLSVACSLSALAGMAPGAAWGSAPERAADSGATIAGARADDLGEFVRTTAPTIVTIKFVLKVSGAGEENEEERETPGVLIDDKGLILCSNMQTGGQSDFMRKFMGGRGITMRAQNIKVLVGDDSEGVDAKVIARDGDLDLAWIQINAEPAKPYAFINFMQGASPEIGQPLFGIERAGQFFDRAPQLIRSSVAALAKRPRALILPADQLGQTTGTAIFDDKGRPVGITALILPNADDLDATGNFERTLGNVRGMIIPAKDVAAATERAREFAKSGQSPDGPEPAPNPDDEAGKPGNAPESGEKPPR